MPEVGGHTNFRNANVHVKPRTGDAIFFSYIDPITLLTDNKLTEHSGCPVIEGEKKIVTQWVRYGVDKENPWHSFNTRKCLLSIKKEWQSSYLLCGVSFLFFVAFGFSYVALSHSHLEFDIETIVGMKKSEADKD